MAKIDARGMGCRCDDCWLGIQARSTGTYMPVLPEQEDPDAKNIAVAQMPGTEEVLRRRPIIGETWKALNRGFGEVGLKRTDFRIDNAILCMPENGNWDRMENDYKKEVKALKAHNARVMEAEYVRGDEEIGADTGTAPPKKRKGKKSDLTGLKKIPLHPVEACRPHLLYNLERTPNVLVLGSVPFNAFTGARKAVKEIRGAFIERWLAERVGDGARLIARPSRERDRDDDPLPPPAVKHPGEWKALKELHLVPTFNPFLVGKEPALRDLFQADLRRFVRWRDGKLEWQKPRRVTNPSPPVLQKFLNLPKRFYTYDIETDGKDPETANMRCISIVALEGSGDAQGPAKGAGVVIHFRSIGTGVTADGRKYIQQSDPIYLGDEPEATPERSHYAYSDAVQIRRLLIEFLTNPKIPKVGHNAGMFDTQILMRVLPLPDPLTVYSGHVKDAWEDVFATEEDYKAIQGTLKTLAEQSPEAAPVLTDVPIPADLQPVKGTHDTILYFRGGYSELTRDLYTLGTLMTDVPAWKSDADDRKKATDAASDDALGDYCLTDSYVDALCTPRLAARVRARRQSYAVALDHGVQQVARGMTKIGLYVDQKARKVKEEEYNEKLLASRKNLKDLLGGDDFNPNSTQQLVDLIYTRLGAPPIAISEDTGEPSTDDATLVMLKRTPGALTEVAEAIIDEIRRYRNYAKQLGTYILPWRMHNDLRKNSDGVLVGGICGPDGRLHPSYNVARPKTGRISSSGPNAQNVGKELRKLVIPEPGHCFIGADYDQIELRLVSAIARCMTYIAVFQGGGDPHAVTAGQIYGKRFLQELEKSLTPEEWANYLKTGSPVKAEDLKTKQYESLRTFAKSFVYAVIYGGTAETIYNVVSLAEDDNGVLMFPNMTRGEVKAAYDAWIRNTPEIPKWWEEVERFCRRHGYVEEPFLGRRRDFPNFDKNEALNLPIQGGAAIIMGRGLVRLARRIPFNFDARTGIINQCHDAVTLEVPESEAVRTAEIVQESLYAQYAGVDFTAKASKAVYNWKAAA